MLTESKNGAIRYVVDTTIVNVANVVVVVFVDLRRENQYSVTESISCQEKKIWRMTVSGGAESAPLKSRNLVTLT